MHGVINVAKCSIECPVVRLLMTILTNPTPRSQGWRWYYRDDIKAFLKDISKQTTLNKETGDTNGD